jgi:signal transduction histidine kinase
MWVGTHKGGLQLFDREQMKFRSYRHDPANPFSIANNDIRSIDEDPEGFMWVVPHGKGIDKFDRKRNVFYHYNAERNNLPNDYVFQVLVDSRGNLWAATVWGLGLLTPGNEKFKSLYHYPHDPKSLSSNEINCVFEDGKQQIWIGTSKGLNLFDFSDTSFVRYEEGFANMNIGSVVSDAQGNIWCGTMDGISVMYNRTFEIRNFDQSDGLITNEIYNRSCFVNNENLIYFGGTNGVVFFNPDFLRFNLIPPKVIIPELKLLNKTVNPADGSGILQKSLLYTKRVELDYGHKVIGFSFKALNYINPEKNLYKYKLEGFNNEWTDAGSKREATFTNLDPGEYVFKVIACNNDGVWNTEGASIGLHIKTPWYMANWFRALVVMGIVMFFFMIFGIRTNQLRKQKYNLSEQVKERTKELTIKNKVLESQTDDLNNINALLEERQQRVEEQAEELKTQTDQLMEANQELEGSNATKNRLFSIIAHDLKDPFNTILGFSNFLMDEFPKISDGEKIKMIKAINTSSEKVHTLLDNLLKWSRSQMGTISLNKQQIIVLNLVQSTYLVLKEYLQSKKNEMVFNIPVDLTFYGDENTIQTVLRNLLNNAIKFTAEGTITIDAKKEGPYTKIYIVDDGIGMDEETLKDLFVLEKNKTRTGTAGEKGSGLGLLICKDFVELNNGTITATSEKGKGSTFCVALPNDIA